MSQQEQDAIVGRLMREKQESRRLAAALDAELKQFRTIFETVIVMSHALTPEQVAAKLEPIRPYFNVDAYLDLLKRRDQAQSEVVDRVKRLREMGVAD